MGVSSTRLVQKQQNILAERQSSLYLHLYCRLCGAAVAPLSLLVCLFVCLSTASKANIAMFDRYIVHKFTQYHHSSVSHCPAQFAELLHYKSVNTCPVRAANTRASTADGTQLLADLFPAVECQLGIRRLVVKHTHASSTQ